MAPSQTELLSPRTLSHREESLCLRGDDSLYISNPDQTFWSDRCTAVLRALLLRSDAYTAAQIASHLRLLADVVVPSLGPAADPPTKPLLTSNNSPFEPSWNLTDTGSSAIRFTYEPLGRQGGAPSDPFAQKIVAAILPSLPSVAAGFDDRWFRHFTSHLFLTDSEAATARARLPPGVRAPTSFFAFDLDGDKAVFKAYFFPVLKHIATDLTTESVTFDCIRALQPGGAALLPAATALESFLAASPVPCPVEMVAIDCIDPSAGARVKVYGRTESNAFETVRQIATLGGANDGDETREGLDILEAVWHLLHNEKAGMGPADAKAPKLRETLHKGVCYGFELRPGAAVPEVKIYVPLWQYADSDAVIAANLAELFRCRGWEVAERYENVIRESFPRANMADSTGIHSYISFAFSKKKGVYMTMYYSAVPHEGPVAF